MDNTILDLSHKLSSSGNRSTSSIISLNQSLKNLSIVIEKQKAETHQAFDQAKAVQSSIDHSIGKNKMAISNLDKMVNNIKRSFEEIKELSGLMKIMEQTTMQVSDMSNKIKMLSLNARIEASRAQGEVGASFTVIATEMQELAEMSLETVDNIEKTIQSSTNQFQSIIDANTVQLADTNKLADQTKNILDEIVSSLDSSEASNSPSVRKIIKFINDTQIKVDEIHSLSQKVELSRGELSNEVDNTNQFISDLLGVAEGVSIQNISPLEAIKNIASMQVIDVRRDDEIKKGAIENYKSILLDEDFESKLKNLDKEKFYLFVCRSGGRSSRAARIAQGQKFSNIFNLSGGMQAWIDQGLPLIK
jgi:methyl-accepting chemotaxis protein